MVHFLNAAGDGSLPVPMELMPVLAGFTGLALAVVFGAMATKQRATAFAMITLGIGELVATAALMFHHFFGGEGGVNTNRMIDQSVFGLTYSSGIQVYYLIIAWTFVAAIAMRLQTMTPLGRMANACRDNFERARFMGYDPRIVRFLQFSLAGFFAGIGGGLYAITYEIVTFDAVAAPLSANALLMAYIGGSMVFARTGARRGADHAAAKRRQPDVEFLADLRRRAVHCHGDIRTHRPCGDRRGAWPRLARRTVVAIVVALSAPFAGRPGDRCGFVGLIELLSFLTIGAEQGKHLMLFGSPIDIASAMPWAVATGLLVVGGVWLRKESAQLRACLGDRDGRPEGGARMTEAPAIRLSDGVEEFWGDADHPRRQPGHCARRASRHYRPEWSGQDHAVQPDLGALSDYVRDDRTERRTHRSVAATTHQPAGVVAQFPDHLDLSSG